jgi:hypothetical protein
MRLKGALSVLRRDCEFFGMTLDELVTFIERNPYAMKNSTIQAHQVWMRDRPGNQEVS